MTTAYERDAIRPLLLGRFSDMLRSTARHPAMLVYLDNWTSIAPEAGERLRRVVPQARARGLNENCARELMELRTLGVDNGYAQKDVQEVARCSTGWTIEDPNRGGAFRFAPRAHDSGEKVVLGVRIPAGGGIADGEKVIDFGGTSVHGVISFAKTGAALCLGSAIGTPGGPSGTGVFENRGRPAGSDDGPVRQPGLPEF